MTLNFNKNISIFRLFFLFFLFIFLVTKFLIRQNNINNHYHLYQILKNDTIEKSHNKTETNNISSNSSNFSKFKINLKDFETIQMYIFSSNCYNKCSIINKINNEEKKIIEKIKNKWNFTLEVNIKRENKIHDLDMKINHLIKNQTLIKSQIEELNKNFFKNANNINEKKLLYQQKINVLQEQYKFNQERFQKFERIKFNFIEHSKRILEAQKHKLKAELYSFYELI
ncbi:hypothetical protein H7686_0001295 [Candidatus Phytoplasma asiaticum]|uniref:Effector n=2 Tax=Candidatus Phytoplasma asiaticum TaxID=2763338 RepID=A0AAX3B9T6_9MOLU|nr:hypothetical protein ['Parthenium hysterophorus' phyllody phytoplasma]UQV27438.1 hypothetical protein H7686_0001295 ['Parthenium hysterophorus' phyllody phytoplasma]